MPEPYDLAVVGAGPAGLAGAVEAASGGMRVALLDQQPRVGGAFYRHSAAHARAAAPGALHHDWATFTRLRARLEQLVAAGAIDHLGQHAVWAVEPGFVVHALRGERERAGVRLHAGHVLVASGAYDRTIPFPGWTLPGVMTAGGAQALLKGSLMSPAGPVLVSGTGPLLLVVAAGLLSVGVEIAAVVESSHPLRYLTKPSGWRGVVDRGRETADYVATLARHRVPYLAGHRVVEARSTGGQLSVEVTGGLVRPRRRSFEVGTLLVSHGFVPQLELLVGLDARCRLDADGSLVVQVDRHQRTSVPGLLAAGEVTGVGGAPLALLEGLVAGRSVAGSSIPDTVTARIASQRAFATAMHRVHRVPDDWTSAVTDDTVVCRCEEVTAGALRAACHDLGATDARAAKLLTRAGMGLCQGRTCGRAVEDLVRGTVSPMGGGGALRDIESRTRGSMRTPAQPVPLSVLADLGDS
jgi:pyruvate/2-oxoglutarate dehydrogenase complex dihydrolipoamide dehydrogenase (E3) component